MVRLAAVHRFALAHRNALERLAVVVHRNNGVVLEGRAAVPRPHSSWSVSRSGVNPMRPKGGKVVVPADPVVLAGCASRCLPASSCSCKSQAVAQPLVMVPGDHPLARAGKHRVVLAKLPTAPKIGRAHV